MNLGALVCTCAGRRVVADLPTCGVARLGT